MWMKFRRQFIEGGAFNVILIFLLMSSFFYYPNLGFEGLYVPFNTTVWIFIVIFVIFGVYFISKSYLIYLSRQAVFFIIMPSLLILTGLVTSFFIGVDKPLSWMLRVAAIFFITSFFVSCFQFNLKRSDIEKALFLICVALLGHGLVALAQFTYPEKIFKIIPHVVDGRITGIFQQPNTLASAMVLAIVVVIYLVSMPSFKAKSLGYKFILLLTILITSFIVIITGSRIGLLALILALPIMVVCRYQYIYRKGNWAYFFGIAIITGLGLGSFFGEGLDQTYSKIERLTSERGDMRTHVYAISYQAFLEKPMLGHGIGSFEMVFHQKAAEYQASRGGYNLIGEGRYSHPHNEFLLWAVEGGVIAVLAFIIGALSVIHQMYKLGWKRGGAYLSLFLPIFLHTQVEHPFYISTLHIFLFVFILFIIFNHGVKVFNITISYSALVLTKFVVYMFSIFALVFFITALYFSHRISYVLYSGKGNVSELKIISKHPYFSTVATRSILQYQFSREIDNIDYLRNYAAWLEKYLESSMEIGAYAELITLYSIIGSDDKVESAINRALYYFPENLLILKTIKDLQ